MKQITLDPDVKTVLESATFTPDSVKLNGQLARPMYVRVNKVLELAGGIWNRKRQAHIFGEDPARVLGLAVATGTLDPTAVDISKLPESAKLANFAADLFPTPPDLAARMVQLAQIKPDHRVLEPSAGTGNILRAIRATHPGNTLVAVEIDERLTAIVTMANRVHYGDFLDFRAVSIETGTFDRILMNPPFSNGADIRHIQQAIKFLKPGGRIVAICCDGPRQNEQLKSLCDTWEPLPSGTFKESGTGVNTVLLTITA
jgi:SAM-dependent methyltransferase